MLALTACNRAPSEAKDDRVPTIDEQIGLDDEGLLERQVQAENRVRDCMKAQGFDYVPVDPNAQRAALVGQTGMSSEDFEKQFGYGITTLYEQRLAQAVTGPNKEIRDALPDPDRLNYDRTLYGDDPTATFQEALDSGDFTRLGGCIKQATEAVFGGTAVLQTLQTKLEEVDDKIFSDDRMVKAIGEWSACMREAGYDGLADPDEVDVVLETKLEDIVGSPQERAAFPPGEGPEYDPAALKSLQQEEVAMVAADIECEEEHLEGIEAKVTAEYHTEFRQENADLLDAVPPL
ncbi:MAG: hypothetical protein ACRDJO_05715 [Actinomycetota bacterium]